jgi:hypothetical protein
MMHLKRTPFLWAFFEEERGRVAVGINAGLVGDQGHARAPQRNKSFVFENIQADFDARVQRRGGQQ